MKNPQLHNLPRLLGYCIFRIKRCRNKPMLDFWVGCAEKASEAMRDFADRSQAVRDGEWK